MADVLTNAPAPDVHDYGLDQPQQPMIFNIKGASNYDWGIKNRLSRIFSPKDGNAAVFAIDHGESMGPTRGLERIDLLVPKVAGSLDAIMATRGGFRQTVDPRMGKAIILRVSYGGSILQDDPDHPMQGIGSSMEEALRMDACAVALQFNLGVAPANEFQTYQTLHDSVDVGNRVGMPVLGVVAVGREMQRENRFYLLATRAISEIGCQLIKTYYTETEFEKITCACPVPIIIAGGKVLPEEGALELTYRAISEGARGVDMGRNIFHAKDPGAMANSIRLVVHEGYNAKQAFEAYEELRNK